MVALYINTEVASFVMITGIKGIPFLFKDEELVRFCIWIFNMVICGDSLHRSRGSIICHNHLDRRGFLFSLSIRNWYDFAYRFLTLLFVVALYIDTEVASFAMITVIEESFIFSLRMRNRYDFPYRFLTWLFVLALYMNTEVASFVMITGIEGVSFSL